MVPLVNKNAIIAEYKNSKRGSVSWYFGKNESLVAERTAECLWRLFGKKAKIVNKKNMKVVNFHYKPFADFLQQFGKRTEKHLPSWLLTNNKEYLKWLQIGLIDSDGQIDSTDRTRFDNTSSELIELFGVINKILTCAFPNYMAKEKSIGNLDNVCLENIKQSYRIDILKTADKRLNEYYQAIKTLEIGNESQEEIDVYDIEVDCPTHSFIANNAIVHNSMCTTRLVTGHGVPQLSAIEDCARVKANYPHVALIADGGIRASGDIVKALAIGADCVMIGSLLAGTVESPGEIIEEGGRLYKYYHGMASTEGRGKWFDRAKSGLPSEGVSTRVPYVGRSAEKVIDGLTASVRVGLSYAGAGNIAELQEKARWCRITNAGQIEGTPHGKK